MVEPVFGAVFNSKHAAANYYARDGEYVSTLW